MTEKTDDLAGLSEEDRVTLALLDMALDQGALDISDWPSRPDDIIRRLAGRAQLTELYLNCAKKADEQLAEANALISKRATDTTDVVLHYIQTIANRDKALDMYQARIAEAVKVLRNPYDDLSYCDMDGQPLISEWARAIADKLEGKQ